MAVKIDATLDQKLTCGFRKDMRNLGNFQQKLEILKTGTLTGYFYPKQKMYELMIYSRFFCHDNEG